MRHFGSMKALTQLGGLRPGSAPTASARPLHTFDFGPNPGSLVAKKFVPDAVAVNAALVVVLHGCTQTPEGYDRGTGWTHLAASHGFAVLYPEQQRANNMNGCFNWFEPGDMRRGAGEPASIKAMIDRMIADHEIDPTRVYITGLSAGAAMAGVMLATYPEVFAGGGLIAGLPYGVATSMPTALSRMRSRGSETDAALAALVRNASDHVGPWPTISVWHGTADMTVSAANADATVAQWRGVLGLSDVPAVEGLRDGYPHRCWRNADRIIEEYVVTGMGHGTPLDAANADNAESAGAYLLDVGLSSTQRLAASWGLIGDRAEATISAPSAQQGMPSPAISKPQPLPRPSATHGMPTAPSNVQKIIEDALRSAGLMR